jgi:hypothetical protein
VLTKLFNGDFLNIDFNRDEMKFSLIFQHYLNGYARHCEKYLPEDRVEMTTQECATERVTRYGTTCVSYRTVLTGLFADPVLYKARNEIGRLRALGMQREMSQMMGRITQGGSPMTGMVNMAGEMQAIASDMESLVQMNACAGPGLKRFEQNLLRFAENKPGVRLGGEAAPSSPVLAASPGSPFKDQNYTRLLEALVGEDSRKWGAAARYIRGSVTNVTVSGRDESGRPLKIVGPYGWESLLGRNRGSVTLTFKEGLPECIIYSETAAICRTPDRKIVAAYVQGEYQQ